MNAKLFALGLTCVTLVFNTLSTFGGDPLGYPGGYRPAPSRAATYNYGVVPRSVGYQQRMGSPVRTGLFGMPAPQQWQGNNNALGNCPNGQCGTGSCPNGQCGTGNCPNGQCGTGNCANGQCSTGDCENGQCNQDPWSARTPVNYRTGVNSQSQYRTAPSRSTQYRPNQYRTNPYQSNQSRAAAENEGWEPRSSWLRDSSLRDELDLRNDYFRGGVNDNVQTRRAPRGQSNLNSNLNDEWYGAPARSQSRY